MKVTQEKLPASQIGLEIEIPPDACQKAYEQVIQKLTRSANIPGFRKGKVPRRVLLQRVGTAPIKAEALEGLINDSIQKAIEQESIEAIGNYQLISEFEDLVSQYDPDASLTFSASVDVSPEVKLETYQDLSVKAEEIEYDPQQVDKYLENIQEDRATLIPVEDRSAQMGDVTVVDYRGVRQEGDTEEEIDGATATDAQMELKEGLFVEDLIQGIVGMNIGETKEIPVKFPDDYGKEDLAGVQANFTVTLKEIKEKELPELDDDFAEDVSDFETMAELRESIESQFKERVENQTKQNVEKALVDALVEVTAVDLPATMVEKEVESILTQQLIELENYGMDVRKILNAEIVQNMRDKTRPDAVLNLTQSLCLLEVGKLESIEPSEEEITAKIEEFSKQLEGKQFDPERLQQVVKEDLTKEKVLVWLREKNNVELVPEGSLKPQEEEETAEETESPESEA